MSIRRLFIGAIVASSLLVGASTFGQDEPNEKSQNPPNLEGKTPTEGKPLEEPLKAEIGANTEELGGESKETIPTQTEPKPLPQPKPEPKPNIHPKPKPNYTELTVEATAYVSFCDTGCIGITATGTDVRNNIYHDSGLPIIAVDPKVIPLGSLVEINGKKFIADDTGGSIKGHRIDILVDTHDTSKAFEFGRQTMDIKVFH